MTVQSTLPPQIFEGTIEEIAAQLHASALTGRYKVIVVPEEQISGHYNLDSQHFYVTATAEEFERALDAIAEQNRHLPVLSEEAFDRENLYEEDW